MRRVAVAWALTFAVVLTAQADPTFFVSPGTAVTGDLAWQAAVGGNFVEFDLNSFGGGADIDSLSAGSLGIDVGVGSGLTVSGSTAEVFWGSYGGTAGGAYGTVSGGALLNRDSADGTGPQMIFQFSTPVKGFGAWIFDNATASVDAFRMIVKDVDGNTFISPILDANPGVGAHTVEGWLGVTSSAGITELAIEVGSWDWAHLDQDSFLPHSIYFEVDHIQVVPVPGAVALGALGLALVSRIKRRIS